MRSARAAHEPLAPASTSQYVLNKDTANGIPKTSLFDHMTIATAFDLAFEGSLPWIECEVLAAACLELLGQNVDTDGDGAIDDDEQKAFEELHTFQQNGSMGGNMRLAAKSRLAMMMLG